MRSNQTGISLIESLVALLVLALGVLGLLGVQLRTAVESRTGTHRMQAARLAEDLSERVKSNPLGVAAIAQYAVGWGAAPAAPVNCTTGTCTGAQAAAFDLVRWKSSVTNTLPSGVATSFVSGTDARQLGVMIGWAANEANPTGSADYVAPFNVNVNAGGVSVNCPAGLICHLVYAQP